MPSVFQGVQDCRLPAFKCSKRLRRPPRQQLLQLYSYSYTCPCHLFFRGFKTAVCPPSNAPNASVYLQASPNPPAGLQGNNCLPLPSVFQGVQDCRLPAFKCSKRLRRPPRQQLLQLYSYSYIYMPLPSVFQEVQDCSLHLQMFQMLPQASKATGLQVKSTTLTATCPCHLFFRGFKTAVCPPSNAPNASAGLQGNNSYLQASPNPPAGLQGKNSLPLPSVFPGGSRLPFARLQMLQTPPQASKATTLTAIQLQLYMPLPSVFQGVRDCRLPAFKRSQRSRRPPRQQLLQLHALAISRQLLLQLYMLCHLFFRGFKTAVCPPSNAPNASAGFQGNSLQVNNSYSYMPLPSVFQGVLDCHLPAFKCSKRLRRSPRQQLLPAGLSKPSRRPPRQQLSALAICFSGGSRLPFARLQMLQTPPQASKATTLTAIQLQLYMPLPSVFQGVQDCRLPAFKRSKRSCRPPRQQLLQLHALAISRQQLLQLYNNSYTAIHAPAICFSGGSRLPFARLQMFQMLQVSKATGLQVKSATLTATCPCHLFFRGFKTAVCPPSNAPNASAGLQGNNSYLQASPNPLQGNNCLPLPSVFQGVQDCRLPAFKCSKRLRRPPRQQLSALAICFSGGSRLPFARLQMLQTPPQASKATTLTAIQLQLYMPLPSVFQGVQDCRLPAFKSQRSRRPPTTLTATCPCHLKATTLTAIHALPSVFQGVQDCRLPAFKRSKRFRRLPRQQPPSQQLLQLHALAICFSGGSRLPFARLQMLQTPPQASKATTLTCRPLQTLPRASKATTLCPCHLFFRGFKTAVCPPSNAPNASAGLQGNNSYSYTATAIHALAICFSGGSRLPFAHLQMLQTPPFTCRPLQTLPRQQLSALAICFSGGSRLPFARLQMLQTPPQASKATTLTAIQLQLYIHALAICFSGGSRLPFAPSNVPNASAGFQGNRPPSQVNNSYSYMPLPSVFQGVQDCRLPAFKCSKRLRRPPRQQLLPAGLSKPSRRPPRQQLSALAICFSGGSRLPFARLQMLQTPPQASKATTLTAIQLQLYMPLPSVFQGVQDCRLPAFKRSQRSRRPPRQQLLQLHALAISRQQLLQLYMLCHLFFRGFKTAVCPPSNAPNASAGFQGNSLQVNNSYSYMPLPSVFQGVQDCRPPSNAKRLRRPPRHAGLQTQSATTLCPCHLFSGGSRLPFARLQMLQTPPQASKATTLTAIQLQLYMPLPSVFQGVQDCRLPAFKWSKSLRLPAGLSKPSRRPPRQQLSALAICFSGGSRLPFARLQMLQTLPQASKATTLTATCHACHLFFRGFKTAVCPPLNVPNASAGFQGNSLQVQQLLQLHALAICFSGGSRLPFARLQMLQTPPQASKATTLTCRPLQTLPQASKATTLCPCHLFFRGFKTAVCPPSNAPNASAGLQGNNSYSYSYSYTCPCHLFFRGFKTAVCPPSNAPNARRLQGNSLQVNNSYSYMPLPSVFQGVQDSRLQMLQTPPQASKATTLTCRPLQTSAGLQGNNSLPLPSVFQGVQDCRLPAFKCSKRLRRPPRQQLLQLYSYSYTCPSHLFFKGFKTAVCPPPNASAYLQASPIPPAGLQGNNCLPLPSVFQGVQDCRLPAFTCSKRLRRPPRQQLLQLYSYSYIYMPLPSVFQGVQDCRLPAFKCSKRFRRLPRQQASKSSQQLLQLHALAICFSGGSRLPFARLQMLQTPPQASKATTLTCRPLQTLPQASKATTLAQFWCTNPTNLWFGIGSMGSIYFWGFP